eukprot:107741-Rhodomonas_salina.1
MLSAAPPSAKRQRRARALLCRTTLSRSAEQTSNLDNVTTTLDNVTSQRARGEARPGGASGASGRCGRRGRCGRGGGGRGRGRGG